MDGRIVLYGNVREKDATIQQVRECEREREREREREGEREEKRRES